MRTQISKTFIITMMLVFTTTIAPIIAFADNTEVTETTQDAGNEDAGPVDSYDPPPPPDDDEDPDAPLDGGISLLVAGGIGYGVKKIAEAKRKAKK